MTNHRNINTIISLPLTNIRNDIDNLTSFNLPLLKEALRQAELRIEDENNRKNRIDNRAYALLSLYTALTCALIALLRENSITLTIALLIPLLSIYFIFRVLKSKKYAPLGTMPITWLNKEFIKDHGNNIENENMFAHVLSHILCNIQESLVISKDSNDKRIKLLDNILAISMLCILPVCYLLK